MALVFLATMTVAGGAFIASKVIKAKPGGARLFLQRKNIQFAHKLGLMDDLQAAAAYHDLRKHYAQLTPSRPLVLIQSKPVRKKEARQIYYTGSFKPEMTRYEARLVLGVTETEAKDVKLITKKWRTMMLKNHPDTGGSPFVAAKINEAKEIVLGEKPAKEGGEDDDEDGSSDLDEDDAKAEVMKKRKEQYSPPEAPPRKAPNPDDGDFSEHPAPPYFTWRSMPKQQAVVQTGPKTNFFLKEDLFYRKAVRTAPNFKAYDAASIFPDEPWRLQYVKDMEKFAKLDEREAKKTYEWVEDLATDKETTGHDPARGHWEDYEGNPVPDPRTTHFERKWAKELRRPSSSRDLLQETYMSKESLRIRRMMELQARARRQAQKRDTGPNKSEQI